MPLFKSVCKFACVLLALSFFTASSLVRNAAAQDPGSARLRETTSLRFVPADASFYFSRLRMKEQYDAFVKSNAWTNLMKLPEVKQAVELTEAPPIPELPDVDISEFKRMFDAPENKELIQLLGELISHEAFVYGDVGFAETYELVQKVAELVNEDLPKDDAKLNAEALKLLAKWKMPDLLIGFKITDAKQAEGQLARLEELLKGQLEALPDLKERFSRQKIGAVEFLTLKLDGSLIPWDAVAEEAEDEEAKKNAAKFREALQTKSMVVSLGVVDGYILMSLGDTDEHLHKLGQGELLVDRPELEPLRKAADKRFTNIVYASERFLTSANDSSTQIDNYVVLVEKMLPEAGLDEETEKELMTDVRGLAVDLKSLFPKAGAYLGFGFLSPRGTEGYAYDWSERLSTDGSQRLSILDHVGGNPLGFYAWRSKYAPEWHEARAKWFGRLVYWSERFGLMDMPREQVKIYEKLRTDLLPLVVRLDAAIKTMWIPAFKDGQNAIVMDAKLTSVKWSELLPPSTKPLPLLEVGLVSGVSDAPLLKQAGGEFFDIVQKTADVLNKHFPDEIPKTEIPLPKVREFPEGTIYFYSPPAEAGVDPQIAPNAGLSKDTLALSYVPKFSLRLLQNKPLEIKEGPLARANQPLAVAWHLDVAGIVEALSAWGEYASDLDAEEGIDADKVKNSRERVQAGVEFLKCLRSISSVSYIEGGALVTHSEWNVVDQK